MQGLALVGARNQLLHFHSPETDVQILEWIEMAFYSSIDLAERMVRAETRKPLRLLPLGRPLIPLEGERVGEVFAIVTASRVKVLALCLPRQGPAHSQNKELFGVSLHQRRHSDLARRLQSVHRLLAEPLRD